MLKALAFPASAAFMMSVGVTAIHASETDSTDTSVTTTLPASNTVVEETSTDPVVIEDNTTTENSSEAETKQEETTEAKEETENAVPATQAATVTQAPVQQTTPRSASIATIDGVAKDYATLQEFINAAKAGQTITLLKDLTENITINKAIILDLNGHTLTGLGTDSVVKISDAATVKNGTITGGNAKKKGGGGIYISSQGKLAGEVLLENLSITGNSTSRDGGGIYTNKSVTIKNCVISKNVADNGAGGISTTGQGETVNIIDSEIINNTTKSSTGGGILISTSTAGKTHIVNIVNSKINGNKAQTSLGSNYYLMGAGGGAGISLVGWNCQFTLSNCEIKENIATGYGGGIRFSGGTIPENVANLFAIKNTTITGNTATAGGGMFLYQNNKPITLSSELKIYNNKASAFGDDIVAQKLTLIIEGNPASESNSCGDKINGWFDDSEGNRWNAHSDNHENDYIKRIVPGTFTDGVALKAAHSNGKVIIHYVDDKGNTISADDTLIDATGNNYSTSPKTISKYTYVRVDGNESGTYGDSDEIEITYVYTLTKGKVIIHYVDQNGNKLTGDITIDDVLDKKYTSEKKSFDGYTFVDVNGNPEGVITEGTTEVTYVYKKVETPKTPDEPKKDDTKKSDDPVQPKEEKSEVQPTSTTTVAQSSESTGVPTGTETNATYLTSLAGISLAGAVLLRKKKNQE